MEHLSEPAPASAQALQQPDVDTTLEDSQPTSFMEVYDAAYAHKYDRSCLFLSLYHAFSIPHQIVLLGSLGALGRGRVRVSQFL